MSLQVLHSTAVLACSSLPCCTTDTSPDEVDFKRDIAPILEERCWYCHGEDEQESGLRLDLRAKMLRVVTPVCPPSCLASLRRAI